MAQIPAGTPCTTWLVQRRPESALSVGSELLISPTLWLMCIVHVGEQILYYCLVSKHRMGIISQEIHCKGPNSRFSKLEFWVYIQMSFTIFNNFVTFHSYIHMKKTCMSCIYGQNCNLKTCFSYIQKNRNYIHYICI